LKKFIPHLFVLFFVGFLTQACRKNDLFTKDAVSLQFSTDTVFFDTIFSKLGNNPNSPRSITLQVRVTNPDANAVKTNISLLGNFYGIFKLNVDGRAGNVFNDIEIRGNDSIYIFVSLYNINNSFLNTYKTFFIHFCVLKFLNLKNKNYLKYFKIMIFFRLLFLIKDSLD
jgi:hypothetical protein